MVPSPVQAQLQSGRLLRRPGKSAEELLRHPRSQQGQKLSFCFLLTCTHIAWLCRLPAEQAVSRPCE